MEIGKRHRLNTLEIVCLITTRLMSVDTWENRGVKSLTSLRIAPNTFKNKVHNRMPVIFSAKRAKAFLDDASGNLLKFGQTVKDDIKMDCIYG